MNPDDFLASPGRVENGNKGYFYFVPPELPRKIQYSEAIVNRLSKADQQLGQLSSLGLLVPNPHLLIRPYVHREALLSSKIEGTQASLSDVFIGEVQKAPDRPVDVLEVLNYIKALNFGVAAVGTRPLDLALLKELHAILLKGVRGEDKDPGEFRRHQNWIGAPGSPIEDASYVPPEPTVMNSALKELESYLAKPPSIPVLLQAALLHYQFEAIHPFRDGNGRIGRIMAILLLLQRRVLSAPLLYLSAFFEKNRNSYYQGLMNVSQKGDYESWFQFFLEGVSVQSLDALERARRLVELQKQYRAKVTARHATAHALVLLDRLFENPYITIPRAAEILKVTFPTAQRAIEKYLVPAGVLQEVTGQERYRRFVARDVLRTLEADLLPKGQQRLPLPPG